MPIASSTERIKAKIGPHVRASSPVLAEFEAVDVRAIADLEHRNQLMLRAVEAAHASRIDRAQCNVAPEYQPHLLGLSLVDDQRAILDLIQ